MTMERVNWIRAESRGGDDGSFSPPSNKALGPSDEATGGAMVGAQCQEKPRDMEAFAIVVVGFWADKFAGSG
jgi:hypothetical protein